LKGNGKGNGVNRKGRKERKEAKPFFLKEKAFAVLCVLGVLCGSGLCRCRSFRIPHFAFRIFRS